MCNLLEVSSPTDATSTGRSVFRLPHVVSSAIIDGMALQQLD